MAFMRGKQQVEEVEKYDIAIWNCDNPDCNAWMRQLYSFEKDPVCPLCQSTMSQEIRLLPVLSHSISP
ncbi:cold-inducible protein YdjO-related protein [Aneurinibacillus terranovensis]|uniref:cold-inducible protein YdjO-related protein n=1 Tax=Aneurinibacillus terranovensis TaxID=278991 RepID=UPI000401C36E|nr:cold-inducible protein YdjO-related protein [Aneurinibacillus terranovensis]